MHVHIGLDQGYIIFGPIYTFLCRELDAKAVLRIVLVGFFTTLAITNRLSLATTKLYRGKPWMVL